LVVLLPKAIFNYRLYCLLFLVPLALTVVKNHYNPKLPAGPGYTTGLSKPSLFTLATPKK